MRRREPLGNASPLNQAVLLGICAGLLFLLASAAEAQTVNDPGLRVKEVVAGLSQPTTMQFIGPDDILVLQKGDGRVRRVLGGVLQPGEVLDLAVDSSSERGLLGIAVHPEFPAKPFVYLFYTESSTGLDTSGSPSPLANRVYRFTWDGSALINPTLILDLPVTPGPNHDGGIITFGPDGKLYVVIGDLNHNGQLQNLPGGPLPDDTGVILRINEDGSIPSDNPFFGQGGKLAKYYGYGIRNSFGMAFDPLTNKLWMTENGPGSFDEINMVEAGFNGGWRQILGPDARDPQGITDLFVVPGSHYADPKFSWFEVVAPTGIVFFSSVALGQQYQGDPFVGDFNTGTLYHFKLNATRDGFVFQHAGLADLVADDQVELQELIFGTGFGGITDLKVGPDGLLYILSLTEGKIFVVSRGPDTLAASVLPTERTGRVGGPAVTAFATVLNTGPVTALGCAIAPLTVVPATFTYQTTDAQNALSGTPNTPVDIPPGQGQNYVFAFAATAPFPRTEIALSFACTNTAPAPITPVSTFGLRATATPASDIVALAATLGNDGILRLASAGAFAVATVNVGASGLVTVSADTGAAALPLTLTLCETNSQTGQCLAPPSPSVQTQINAGATPTFSVFADSGNQPITFDPTNNRIRVRFEGGGGGGGTSVAVCTQPLCP